MRNNNQLPYDKSVFEALEKINFELTMTYFDHNIYVAEEFIPVDFGDAKMISDIFAVSKSGLKELDGYCFFSVDINKPTNEDVLYRFMLRPDVTESILENSEFVKFICSELVAGNTLRKLNQLDYSKIVSPGNPRTLVTEDLLKGKV